jgi:hypothetical protein
MTCLTAPPAAAGAAPYVRLDYGASQLRMTDVNNGIRDAQAALQADGYPAEFKTMGSGYGPSASVGAWIRPGFRLGATYSHLRAVRENRLDVPGEISYADDLDFQMDELGAEAAMRFEWLAGLTVGANVAQGRAESIESYSRADAGGSESWVETARRTKTTFGAFVGMDQTNAAGVAGFIRVGFQYRDMGRMPGQRVSPDGTQTPVETTWLDYSGVYVTAGFGFDLVR